MVMKKQEETLWQFPEGMIKTDIESPVAWKKKAWKRTKVKRVKRNR